MAPLLAVATAEGERRGSPRTKPVNAATHLAIETTWGAGVLFAAQ